MSNLLPSSQNQVIIQIGLSWLFAFWGTFIGIPILERTLKKAALSHQFRPLGPAHENKHGTPSLGGLMIAINTLISFVIWAPWNHILTYILIGGWTGIGALGFWDDWLKLKYKNHRGISAKHKMIWLSMITFFMLGTFWLHGKTPLTSNIIFPLISKQLPLPIAISMILWWFMVVGGSNASNLTDGLDGLLASITIPLATTLIIIKAIQSGFFKNISHLDITITIFLAGLIGSLCAFMWYNSHPASIFMGDTGSLPIGGILSYIAILMNIEIFYALLTLPYIIEAVSVMLQVFFFKKTGKRLFLMAPIHHHFEKLGIAEEKITSRAFIISCLLGIITIILYSYTY